jgi:hypothetical protein
MMRAHSDSLVDVLRRPDASPPAVLGIAIAATKAQIA